MENNDPAFYLFPALPEETRLQIWAEALPDSRVIELSFTNVEDPSRRITFSWERDGKWFWTCRPEGTRTILALLQVCSEARNIVLESYQSVSICDQSDADWTRLYMDYSRDTIYLSTYSFNRLLNIQRGSFPPVNGQSVWINRLERLGITARTVHVLSNIPIFSFGQFLAESRPKDLQLLAEVFETFVQSKELLLFVDGRNYAFKGQTQIAEPTTSFEDYYIEDGRTMSLSWISGLVKDLKSERPDLKIGSAQLRLLINGPDTSEMEHRWDYYHNCCHFCPPGYQGHRPVSEPSDSGSFDSDS